MVLIAQPPPTTPPHPLFHTIPAGTYLVRLFNPARFGTTALTFNHYGPLNRFDHHRLPPPGAGAGQMDPDRSIYYAAFTLSCCLVEVFGDYRLIDNPAFHVARPRVIRSLRLLNLCDNGAMLAGSVTALCGTADRALSQQWSRYFYDTPEYQQCDGLLFHGAHNNERAVALYERAQNALECPTQQVIALNAPSLRLRLLDIAAQHGMAVLI